MLSHLLPTTIIGTSRVVSPFLAHSCKRKKLTLLGNAIFKSKFLTSKTRISKDCMSKMPMSKNMHVQRRELKLKFSESQKITHKICNVENSL